MKRTTHTERWKPVVGYEGYYEVSSWGRVRSLDREYVDALGRNRRVVGRVLRPSTCSKGYQKVTLSLSGDCRNHSVHVLVAAAFIGPRPVGFDVMHADDNPSNNHVSNLSYGTPAENNRQRDSRGRNGQSRKTECPKGHAYSPENTRIGSKGGRNCRACARDRYHARKHLRKVHA